MIIKNSVEVTLDTEEVRILLSFLKVVSWTAECFPAMSRLYSRLSREVKL